MRRVISLLSLATLALAGCPDAGDPRDQGPDTPPARDRGPEQGALADAPSALPDLGLPAACDKRCLEQGLHLCVTSSAAAGRCVECTANSHCQANPGALGPRCDVTTNRCTCAGDGDCAGNLRGPRCNTTRKICTCRTAADCEAALPLCLGAGDAKTCHRPCQADADCEAAGATVCHKASGRCVACVNDNHCAGHPNGAACRKGQCGCATSLHCNGLSWGGLCAGSGDGRRCGCTADAHCQGNPNGPTCHVASGRCSCDDDQKCTRAPFTHCSLPYAGATYRRCSGPCSSHQECAALGAGLNSCVKGHCVACSVAADCGGSKPHCDAAAHRCVACLTNAHCSGGTPVCDQVRGVCAQCSSHGHCATSMAGGTCVQGSCGCTASADCKDATWGSTCHPAVRRCSCAADADCKGIVSGPSCDLSVYKCVCKSHSDCAAPASRCALPYLGAAYRNCRPPCAADQHCAGLAGLTRCDAKLGLCLPCLSDTHCAALPFARICDVSGALVKGCVQCKADADCGKASLGASCSTSDKGGTCHCAAASDCAGNLNGRQCHPTLQICSCTKHSDCPAGRGCSGSYQSYGLMLCK